MFKFVGTKLYVLALAAGLAGVLAVGVLASSGGTPAQIRSDVQASGGTPEASETPEACETPEATEPPEATEEVAETPEPCETPEATETRLCADVDNDGSVTARDIVDIVRHFGTNDAAADVDSDGSVTASDIVISVHEFGTTCHR